MATQGSLERWVTVARAGPVRRQAAQVLNGPRPRYTPASQVWTKPLGNHSHAVMLLSNATNTTPPINIAVPLAAIDPGLAAAWAAGHLYVRDLYAHAAVAASQIVRGGVLTATAVPSHDSRMYVLSTTAPPAPPPPNGTPVVREIVPRQIPAGGGTAITVRGAGFGAPGTPAASESSGKAKTPLGDFLLITSTHLHVRQALP